MQDFLVIWSKEMGAEFYGGVSASILDFLPGIHPIESAANLGKQ